MNDQLKPVAEVSHETFSSDGTSDIITCNLPIGTKLYALPEGCAVAPVVAIEQARELLVDIAGMIVEPFTMEQCRDPESLISRMAAKLNQVDAILAQQGQEVGNG
ncbi:hypothetical protein SA496_15740 [Pseudomonas sp. JS3066]|uniref:hypothetical protein n=1 Tax=Pseudomonas sp. JS3066 TaxID=3090665 RepID=UPI002E7B3608|nr:hypothetical protein [Pseudomonas sp. JS3066]WVK91181.1 hypothetical protein SA496_15740 [Pseudomonas sp. JS3066]